MKQDVHKCIRKFVDGFRSNSTTIRNKDEFLELIKSAKTPKDFHTAAFAYLQFVVPELSKNPNTPEECPDDTAHQKPLQTEGLTDEIEQCDETVKILMHLSFLWNANTLEAARRHAHVILDILLKELDCNDDSNDNGNLFCLSSPSPRTQKHQHIHCADSLPFQFYRSLLSTVVPLTFRLLDKDVSRILQQDHSNYDPAFAYEAANILRNNNLYAPAALLYEKTLASKSVSNVFPLNTRLDAYNGWGLCKLRQRYVTDARKIYSNALAMTKEELRGKDSTPCTDDDIVEKLDDAARGAMAYIYWNLAYVLILLAEYNEFKPQRAKSHKKEALRYLEYALKLAPGQKDIFYASASVCRDLGKYDDACAHYRKYYEANEEANEDDSCAWPAYLDTRYEQLLSYPDPKQIPPDLYADIRKCQTGFCNQYHRTSSRLHSLPSISLCSEDNADLAETIHSCIALGEQLNETKLGDCLLKIYFCTRQIRSLLRYHIPLDLSSSVKVPPIAYYTTLPNADYLLKKSALESETEENQWPDAPKNSRNRLTMMHTSYMNDPNEGNALIKSLSTTLVESKIQNCLFIGSNHETFRRKLLDQKFVFLKSFTRLVDQLNMWSTYASDRSSGSDSNGCCICIAPQTFLKMQSASSGDPNIGGVSKYSTTKVQDDFNLYHVAYIKEIKHTGKDGIKRVSTHLEVDIPQGSRRRKLLDKHYTTLLRLFRELNQILDAESNLKTHNSLTAIWEVLGVSLSLVDFLFKDADYAAEKELRLVLTRPIRNNPNPDEIRKTDTKPPKLFVMPPYQIYVSRIILGPKVSNPDSWIPHLQLQLAEMWESWSESDGPPPVPKVRKSAISYRD